MINPALLRLAGQGAALQVPERYPGYRNELFRQLAELIKKRDSAAGPQARKQLCQAHIDVLAIKLLEPSSGGER
jgi:hypothetical protein